MESGHEGGTCNELKENQIVSSPKGIGSSSSSSSSSKDLTDVGADGTQLASAINEEDFATSFQSRLKQPNDELNNELATESPPAQVMERTDEDDNDSADPNRIPPHVFARTQSNNPAEWSIASNESLFSIHMGNMSFTRDQLSWMGKSGELGSAGDIQWSGPLIDLPSMEPATPTSYKSPEPHMRTGSLNQGLGTTEATAAEPVREVISENAIDHTDEKLKLSLPKKDPCSLNRDSSTKSFAFPILTGDVERSTSLKGKKRQPSQPVSPKASEPQTPVATQSPKANNKTAGKAKWCSCFSRCSMC
ncbi:uncharacterized protein LOC123210761 [Mangifera indica]|uniref:uncharacterized protein LOC123210761 n=1 Tax=Mangifera indica TaxID=29780 RepID=UPI001CF98F0F|nr:uncharacterized protein LOC123210761 [Mangifera indica]